MLTESRRQYLIGLKNRLLFRTLVNNLFIIVFGIIILLFTINHIYIGFIYLIYIYFLYKKNKIIFYTLIVTSIIIVCVYLLRMNLINDKGYDCFEGIVISITKKESYNKLLIKKGMLKVIAYDFDYNNINIGDRVKVTGFNIPITTNRLEDLFDYQKYYYSSNVVSIIGVEEIESKSEINIYYLRNIVYKYITTSFKGNSQAYMLGMILGDSTNINEGALSNIRINGISHLFAISGLHISLLVKLMSKILTSMKIKEKTCENSIIICLVLYLVITNFMVSILRAGLMYILGVVNKRIDLKLSSLDIISFIFIIIIIYNPWYMYYLGFILSFLASFFIILLSQTIKAINLKLNTITELFLLTVLLQVVSFPIVANINYSFNILSVITNVFFISLVTTLILPITFVVLFFPFLKTIYGYIINSFDFLNNFFSKYIALNIDLPAFNTVETIIYYLFLIILIIKGKDIFKGKKKIIYIFSFLAFLFVYYNKINLNINGNVYFLDILEGDCTVIDLPMNKGIVVIDTGTEKCTEVISFLKAKGVRKIDYLVLTHNHSDHNGNGYNIINEFKVNKLVVSAYDNSSYNNVSSNTEYELVKVRGNDSFYLNDYVFDILGPNKRSGNENENSIIIYSKLGSWNYLFLGDSTKRIEEELIKYNLNVDCVKASHHGSKTSSSELFYQNINPRNVIIETGRIEKYGFPHDEAIDVLSKYELFRTDINYSVKVQFYKKRSIISSLK